MENEETGSVEIETSTDSVEDVKAALGEGVEIEESPAGEQATQDTEKPAGEESETPEGEEEEQPAETETGETEGEADEPDEQAKVKDKPKDGKSKQVPPVVPKARLDAEIHKRKDLERQLAESKRAPAKEAEPEAETPAAEEPTTFSGEAEPQLSDFTKDVDDLDPKAMAEATAKFTQAHHQWSRKEARAEADYRAEQQRIIQAREERLKPFREAEERTIDRHPDYRERVKASKVFVSTPMETFCYESEIGPDILLHFIDNPNEAARIAKLPTVKAQRAEMDKLEAKIQAELEGGAEEEPQKKIPPKKPVTASSSSKAPPPASRMKTTHSQPKSLEELAGPADRTGVDIDFNPEYEKAYNSGRR